MTELLEILNNHGESTGISKSRKEVHKDGDPHGTVHLWIIQNGKILLQKRSAKKKLYPKKYVASASGHITFGISKVQTVIEEVYEEIGIKLTPEEFYKIGTVSGSYENSELEISDHEFIHLYISEADIDIDLNFSNDEVDSLVWMTPKELRENLNKYPENFVPCFEEYDLLLSHCKYQLDILN